ncbi:uncharacterized protein BO96DRAFT_422153 [Aspergillus niger CBS 101883]|uniref:uncharacterized protein n=1 Tax=Aspergillus lacticoffeatus (strain CBS 101883) TaxID=1450533 RepID=UPI000D7F08CB|nr:uncharacterized protein BO96DRAFT_422153 [Aspergillus niger CBS 101883]PYH57832.1 hypothetical protein BO96DRAFT_422153 [Aspergillus niger CBS 101883]
MLKRGCLAPTLGNFDPAFCNDKIGQLRNRHYTHSTPSSSDLFNYTSGRWINSATATSLILASEVATKEDLGSHGIPVPEIYGYSASADNSAGTDNKFVITDSLPTNKGRFCLGPDTSLRPCADAEKEIAYISQFGKSPQPFQRLRRETYDYKLQSHLDYITNLK